MNKLNFQDCLELSMMNDDEFLLFGFFKVKIFQFLVQKLSIFWF